MAEPSRLPSSLAEFHEQLRLARASAHLVAKRCLKCNVDVALDGFRARSGDGYLCSDCLPPKEEPQFVVRKLKLAIILLAALTVMVAAAVYIGVKAGQMTSVPRKR